MDDQGPVVLSKDACLLLPNSQKEFNDNVKWLFCKDVEENWSDYSFWECVIATH